MKWSRLIVVPVRVSSAETAYMLAVQIPSRAGIMTKHLAGLPPFSAEKLPAVKARLGQRCVIDLRLEVLPSRVSYAYENDHHWEEQRNLHRDDPISF
jgi:hypothetical protein